MRIAVAKETRVGEWRVALVPEVISTLVQVGYEVWVETNAGAGASYTDADYAKAGATIVTDDLALWEQADVMVRIGPLTEAVDHHYMDRLRPGAMLIGFLSPLAQLEVVQRLAARDITCWSMDCIPRLSRAQSMDALSSQAQVAGYKATLLAADACGKFFPMIETWAGTLAPATVLVIGADAAGLMAMATARRLGAVVEAFDVRSEVREDVERLGATFIGMEMAVETEAQRGDVTDLSAGFRQSAHEVLAPHVQQADVVIATAHVPGQQAPIWVTETMVAAMQPGSVIVDLAAAYGGNCACTQAGGEVRRHDVKILGPCHVPSLMPVPASQMYAKNIMAVLQHVIRDGALHLDFTDTITQGACVTHAGAIPRADIRQAIARLTPLAST